MTDCNPGQQDKPWIDLSLNQVGVIIIFNSGVIYQNQTCGHLCKQRCEEGVLMLPTDPELVEGLSIEIYQCPIEKSLRKMEWWSVPGLSSEIASEIDSLLQNYGLTRNISVDKSLLEESEEAWIYVRVEPAERAEYPIYTGFGSCRGVLVWSNSD